MATLTDKTKREDRQCVILLFSSDNKLFSYLETDAIYVEMALQNSNSVCYPIDKLLTSCSENKELLIVDLKTFLNENETIPFYIKKYLDIGCEEIALLSLIDEAEHPFGVLVFPLEKKGDLAGNNYVVLKEIASHITAILKTRFSKAETVNKEKEKTVLLSLSTKIGRVKNKEVLLSVIHHELKELFYFTHCSIAILDQEKRTFTTYLIDPNSQSKKHPEFKKMTTESFPVDDGIFDLILQTQEPIVFRAEDIIQHKELPLYTKIHLETGVKEGVAIAMLREDSVFGVLSFYSDKSNVFTDALKDFLTGISSQIAIAVSNIMAIEEIQERNREREMLLKLSYEIARIKHRNDLLKVINTTLKKLFYFAHSIILQIQEEQQKFRVFLADPNSKSTKHPDYQQMLHEFFPLNDGIMDHYIKSDEPIITSVRDLKETHQLISYTKLLYDVGIKEWVTFPLYNEKGVMGILAFFSDEYNTFDSRSCNIVKSIAHQISIAVSNIIAYDEIHERELEKEMLLGLSYETARIKDRNDLLDVVNRKLRGLFYFCHTSIAVINEDGKTFSVFFTDKKSKSRIHPEYNQMVAAKYPIHDGLFNLYLETDEPTLSDVERIALSGKGPHYNKVHYEAGLKQAVSIPLYSKNRVFALLTFFSDIPDSFEPKDLKLIKGISNQIAFAVANIMAHEEIRYREQEKSTLLSLSYEMARIKSKEDLLRVINEKLRKQFYFRHSCISVINEDKKSFVVFFSDPNSASRNHPQFLPTITSEHPIYNGLYDQILDADEPIVLDVEKITSYENCPPYLKMHKDVGIKEIVNIRLYGESKILGVLSFFSDNKESFSNKSLLNFIKGISNQVAIAVANILANEAISRYKQQLEQENLYLQEEIGLFRNYSDIIGESAAMQKVYRLLSQVAYTTTTVLILGETGTGKELIARAIHENSPRKGRLMIKVNCAALPQSLVESELFGHEKGSFTGAMERRIGKFELANNSTLFLDEIGELPLELQAKLLRAIQEKEIERLGGKQPIRVDVRIIAATNRDLLKEMSAGRFRSDLFYRLNVFPIFAPPLRERKEDISLLVNHFLHRFSLQTGRKITGVSPKALQEMMEYSWPGNIRELEHLLERNSLLANGPIIQEIHLPVFKTVDQEEPSDKNFYVKSIDEVEREHIIKVLDQCNGKIQGAGGAAHLLKIPPTTLHSKIKKLGIKKRFAFDEEEDDQK